MSEPTRQTDLSLLVPYVRERVEQVLDAMKARGFDPVAFETLRSQERQNWLYGVGRTHSLDRKPITWTLRSKHIVGKAVDVISMSRGWNHPQFFTALKQEANKAGLVVLKKEQCHLEWQG